MKILVEEKNGNKLYRERGVIIIQKDTISVSYGETLEDSEGEVLNAKSGGYILNNEYFTLWKNTKTKDKTLEQVIEEGVNSVLAVKDIASYLYPESSSS